MQILSALRTKASGSSIELRERRGERRCVCMLQHLQQLIVQLQAPFRVMAASKCAAMFGVCFFLSLMEHNSAGQLVGLSQAASV
jgi:hypothetical protein